ncbi:MAG TPA: hypothetical protein VLV78_14665, partial [Thermoanaerobaculia bacterium]|nr:hypothetical protein [Thermoanaerobaculia bacterium]
GTSSRHPESAKRDEGSQDAKTPATWRSFAVFAAQDDVNNDLRRDSVQALATPEVPQQKCRDGLLHMNGRRIEEHVWIDEVLACRDALLYAASAFC